MQSTRVSCTTTIKIKILLLVADLIVMVVVNKCKIHKTFRITTLRCTALFINTKMITTISAIFINPQLQVLETQQAQSTYWGHRCSFSTNHIAIHMLSEALLLTILTLK